MNRGNLMKKTDCIIVTYNPTEKFEENIKNILSQIRKLYIVDNNSSSKNIIKNLEKHPKIQVIYNENNIGLGAAQNIGIRESLKNNSDWILLFDDDTEIPHKYVESMLNEYKKIKDDKISILFPRIEHKNSKKKTLYVEYNKKIKIKTDIKENNTNILVGMASGSLIKSEVIKKIGLFKEDYFIEYIDYEFCLRNIKNGYLNLLVAEIQLNQRVGNTKDIKIGNIVVSPSWHNPIRLYYKLRNFIWLRKEYNKNFPEYMRYEILKNIWIIIRSMIFESDKILRIKYIQKGLKDGYNYKK